MSLALTDVKTRVMMAALIFLSILHTGLAQTTLADIQASLRISEIMFAPRLPSTVEKEAGFSSASFQFIELWNDGSTVLDLNGISSASVVNFGIATNSACSFSLDAEALDQFLIHPA